MDLDQTAPLPELVSLVAMVNQSRASSRPRPIRASHTVKIFRFVCLSQTRNASHLDTF
jgi:hypothetical protein